MITTTVHASQATGLLDGGTPTSRWVLRLPAWLKPKWNPGEAALLYDLVERGASNSDLRVFGYYTRACLRWEAPYFYERQKYIASALGLSTGQVSESANWLVRQGFLGKSKEVINGQVHDVHWCLWMIESRANQIAKEPVLFREPGVHFSEPGAVQKNETKDCIGLSVFEMEKTTTDASPSSSFSEGPEESKIPEAEPIHPAELVEAIDNATDSERLRARLKAEAATWSALFTVEWIGWAVKEFQAKQAIVNDPNPVIVPARWIKGLLDTWRENGKATPRLALKAIEAEAKQKAAAESERLAAEARRAKAIEAQASADRDAALKARWDALTEPDRELIRADVRAANPALARMKLMVESLCLATLVEPG